MLRRAVAVLAATTGLVAGCVQESDEPVVSDATTTTAGTSTTGDPGDQSFTPEPIEWESCGRVECATVRVPLDYDDPGGERIGIHVVRSAADGDRKGALFVNPGGPGAGGASFAEQLAIFLPSEITDRFDIVGVDPRGVGGSAPIDCGVPAAELYGVDASIDSPEDEAALLDVTERYVDDCAAEYGDLLPHVGTRDVARDMDSVRAAMGDDLLSYLGFSYGTAIGQVYADLFPDRVRSMVLDAVLELGPSGLELADEQAAGFETALDRFVQYCDAAEGCAIAGRSREVVEEVLALAEQPGGIPAPGADRDAGPGEATLGISHALYSQSLWGQLDTALAEARAGDGTGLVDLADGYLGFRDFEVYFAVSCLDFTWPDDPDEFLAAAKVTAERSPHFGEALVNDYIRCADWPVTQTPLEAVTAPGTPPIVLISTTGDPATPYEAGVAVAQRLENGVLVTNEGEGHGALTTGKPCIDNLVIAYLVDDVVPENGATC